MATELIGKLSGSVILGIFTVAWRDIKLLSVDYDRRKVTFEDLNGHPCEVVVTDRWRSPLTTDHGYVGIRYTNGRIIAEKDLSHIPWSPIPQAARLPDRWRSRDN